MPYQSVVTELTATITTGITTNLRRSCGKETGTIGSEVKETSDPAKIVTVGLPLENCPDPTV